MIAIYKQHRQESGFFLFFIRALFAIVRHSNFWSVVRRRHVCVLRRDTNMASKTWQKHLSLSFAIEMKTFTLELRHIEINASSSARIVLYFDLRDSNFRPPFHVTQRKSLEIRTCPITKRRNPSN